MTAATNNQTLNDFSEIFQKLAHSFLNTQSLIVLFISVSSALLLGRFIASVLRKVVTAIGAKADRSENLHTVNRLRRFETYIVLSIAVIRTCLLLFAFYFWWVYGHPSGQPTAIIGASAFAVIILSSALGPALRDLAAGSFMMAEQWYGVGDHIKIEPFLDMQGVVERVTLRSTRLRGLNGEIMWVNNQHIQGVRLAPKGVRTIGLELFVDNVAAGEKLIGMTNRRLPIGPLLVLNPLEITSVEQVGDELWHITAVGDTAPGREWLLERSAVELIKWLDEQQKTQVIAHGPLARYADTEAEQRFNRSIKNARKRPSPKKKTAEKPKSRRQPKTNS
ncbi:MAG: mechanosensitive ion channel family protein [Patescibacteria group bacterium]|nr:mechanosensitive ion channel family protein [Patescibacteria group bacterium]